MGLVPEIKLIRTDTTLDLSQKAEKVWVQHGALPDIVVDENGMVDCDLY